MTRKDFILIAETCRVLAWDIGPDHADVVAEAFADMCAGTNANFKRERFLAACTNDRLLKSADVRMLAEREAAA